MCNYVQKAQFTDIQNGSTVVTRGTDPTDATGFVVPPAVRVLNKTCSLPQNGITVK
jgi:hypothetical protein